MIFIERQLAKCDLFIMIFSRRFGSPPSNESDFISGTEQEYDIARALRSSSSNQRPELFLYFKKCLDASALDDPGPQLKKVLDFKKRVSNSTFHRDYVSTETFRLEFKDHLTEWMLDMAETVASESIQKRKVLHQLFSLGSLSDHRPSTLIVYPNATPDTSSCATVKNRSDLRSFGDVTHLLPYMVLEDFQAIHKLTKCLNIAGCEEVSASTTDVFDPQAERRHNKIFLCAPRNEHARRFLAEIPEAKMSITGNSPEERVLTWQNQTGSLSVKSPQSCYLRLQRNAMNQWHIHPGNCYCEDFAVFARFRNQATEPNLATLSIMFLFGLRGLGTWGAAWYIDHCYNELAQKLTVDDPYRALLHVVFENNRIRKVTDVSQMDQQFFDTANDENHIRKLLTDKGRKVKKTFG